VVRIVTKENKIENILISLCKVLVCLHFKFHVQFWSLFQGQNATSKGQVSSSTGNQWDEDVDFT